MSRGRLLAVLLTAALCAGAVAAPPAPDADVRQAIDSLVASIVAANSGGADEGLAEAAEDLLARVGGDRRELLRQLTLYLAAARGTEQTMGVALLIGAYRFSDDEIVATLVPWLEADDEGLRAAAGEVLATVDRADGGTVDFDPYRETLAAGPDASPGLVRYLFSVSPFDALVAIAAAVGGREDAVDLARTIERHGPAAADDPGQALAALAGDADWWVRLYAAHAARRRPGPAADRVSAGLRDDPHPAVRDAAP